MKYVLIIIGVFIVITVGFYWYSPNTFMQLVFAPAESSVPLGATPQDAEREVAQEDIVVVAEDLSVPWEVLFLPDESMMVTERSGTLALIAADGSVSRISVEGVAERGEGGLLGATLHPDFTENNWLYLYMTHEAGGGTQNRVVRYVFENNELSDATSIIEGIPGASYHDGGRIAFGPDGKLYITTGDAGIEMSAQDRDSLSGKILRLNDDGSIPSGNPFGTAVYSYGHRNPQGLAWDSEGQLWSTEHGRSGAQSGYDELNRIVAGGNYGWPVIEGDETQDGMIGPVVHSGASDTWAPASLLYRDGVFYWGGLRGNALYAAQQEGESVSGLVAHFRGTYGRIRAVAEGPDGRIYITTSNTDGRGGENAGDDKVISIDPAYLGQ